MKIVVLDGFTLNPGDLSWDAIKKIGNLVVYDRTAPDQIIERSDDAEIILTNKTPLSSVTIGMLHKVRYIGVLATGFNIVDIEAAKARGIIVTNIPTYGTYSVAQMVFALLLELCHHVQAHSEAVKNGEWSNGPDFCFWKHPLIELKDKTLGIIGFGKIGKQVAVIGQALGMQIIAYDSFQQEPDQLDNFQWVEMEEVLKRSDVVSLHCPLTKETEKMINRNTLRKMKTSAFIINTSRGGLIDDQDLAEALKDGLIAGAALDVLSSEPPKSDNPLLSSPNCIITPHIAWATKEARQRLMNIAACNLDSFIAGVPINVISN